MTERVSSKLLSREKFKVYLHRRKYLPLLQHLSLKMQLNTNKRAYEHVIGTTLCNLPNFSYCSLSCGYASCESRALGAQLVSHLGSVYVFHA